MLLLLALVMQCIWNTNRLNSYYTFVSVPCSVSCPIGDNCTAPDSCNCTTGWSSTGCTAGILSHTTFNCVRDCYILLNLIFCYQFACMKNTNLLVWHCISNETVVNRLWKAFPSYISSCTKIWPCPVLDVLQHWLLSFTSYMNDILSILNIVNLATEIRSDYVLLGSKLSQFASYPKVTFVQFCLTLLSVRRLGYEALSVYYLL